MHKIEEEILKLFREKPSKEFSTTEIVESIYNRKFDKKNFSEIKHTKAKLHRKTLYHLNKLTDFEILKVTNMKEKGEKCFSLTLTEGELLIKGKKQTIMISKQNIPLIPIEDYEDNKTLIKYEQARWINKLNAVLINANNLTKKRFFAVLKESIRITNDVVGIINFEKFIEKHSESIGEITNRLIEESTDYSRIISISIILNQIKEETTIKEFITQYKNKTNHKIQLIFEGNAKELNENNKIILHAINEFKENKLKLNIKNTDLKKAPYIIGKIGTYTISDEDWNTYIKIDQDVNIIVIGQTTVVIDINRFFKENNIVEFRELLGRTAKSLLAANVIQRRKSEEFFSTIGEFIQDNKRNRVFAYSSNYIRFWNYDWEEKEEYNFSTLLSSCMEQIQSYTSTEETIYKSCGIPIRFKILFSSLIKKFDENLTEKEYNKLEIKEIKDFEKEKLKTYIKTREQLIETLQGGDRVRFYKIGTLENKEIFKELTYVLNNFRIPYFCFDFTSIKGNTKLSEFF